MKFILNELKAEKEKTRMVKQADERRTRLRRHGLVAGGHLVKLLELVRLVGELRIGLGLDWNWSNSTGLDAVDWSC